MTQSGRQQFGELDGNFVNWQPILVSLVGPLAGAFAGAWLAFLFNSNKERKLREDDHVRNGNLALNNLFEYWNALEQYAKEVIRPYVGKDDAWLNMPPSLAKFQRMPSLRDADLSFILGSGHSSVYAEIYLEEHRYHSIRGTIEHRESLILQDVRPAMAGASIKEGDSVDESVVTSIIGSDKVAVLHVLTDALLANVPQSLESLSDAFRLLRGLLTELYPKKSFIQCDFNPKTEPHEQD